MKCNKCGHRSNSIAAMARHYRKKHPGAMKRHKQVVGYKLKLPKKGWVKQPSFMFEGKEVQVHDYQPQRFCPHCGGFLG